MVLQGDARGIGTAGARCTHGLAAFAMLVVTTKGALGVGAAVACAGLCERAEEWPWSGGRLRASLD